LTKILDIDPMHASAIMGNMAVETGGTFLPSQAQGGGSAYGMLQWDGVRKTALQDYAKNIGGKVDDYKVQLDYMMYEATNKSVNGNKIINGWQDFMSTRTLTGATGATGSFCSNYEGANPAKNHLDRRETDATKIYNYYVYGYPLTGLQ